MPDLLDRTLRGWGRRPVVTQQPWCAGLAQARGAALRGRAGRVPVSAELLTHVRTASIRRGLGSAPSRGCISSRSPLSFRVMGWLEGSCVLGRCVCPCAHECVCVCSWGKAA